MKTETVSHIRTTIAAAGAGRGAARASMNSTEPKRQRKNWQRRGNSGN